MYSPSNNKSKAQFEHTQELRQQLATTEAQFGPDAPETIAAVQAFATHLLDVFEDGEAEPYQRRICEHLTKTKGAEHPDTLASEFRMAELLSDLDRTDESAALHLQVLEARTKVLGAEHPDTLASIVEYADMLEYQESYEQAEALYMRAVESATKVFGPDHKTTKQYQTCLSICHTSMGKTKAAEDLPPGQSVKGCATSILIFAAIGIGCYLIW